MATTPVSRDEISELMRAVQVAGRLEHLHLTDWQFIDYLTALAFFIGTPVSSVDAFLTEVPDASVAEHRVYWLRGNSIGSLVVGAHTGPQGQEEPAVVSGHIRHLSDVTDVEIEGAEFVYSHMGGQTPELRPKVRIHFSDHRMTVNVAARPNEQSREQALTFIARLQDKIAALGK